jgi:hypothetical protein
MNRPKGLALTTILMSVCNGMVWATFHYTRARNPLKMLFIITGIVCIGYFFIWFYWKGRDWARIAVLIFSGLHIFNLRMWGIAASNPQIFTTPFRIMLGSRAVLGAALLYWLNKREVVEFFKRSKAAVVQPQFRA